MNTPLKSILRGLVIALSVGSVACSHGFQSSSGTTPGSDQQNTGSNGNSNGSVNTQVTAAQQAATDAQQAIAAASAALATITTGSGVINLNVFENTGATGGVLAPIIAQLTPLFDDAYNKVLAVKQQYDALKASLAAQLAAMQPTDPNYQLLSEELTEITNLETQFNTDVQTFATELGTVNTTINTFVTQVTSQIPVPGLGVIAAGLLDMFVINDVTNLITDLQTKLMAL